MMANRKIDAALEQELARVEASGDRDRALPILIEHIRGVEAEPGPDPVAQLAAMNRRVYELQQGIRLRLRELGNTRATEQATLANVLTTELSPAQIRAIAEHGDVKRISLNQLLRVTTPG